MKEALKEAEKAYKIKEAPIGAVITKDNKIIARGFNKRETGKNSTLHAEIIAINKACKAVNGWRLCDCNIYITLEPCPMCAGAIINSRIPNVYFGAYDFKNGCCGSVIDLFNYPFNHKPKHKGGILKEECSNILTSFFKDLRNIKE